MSKLYIIPQFDRRAEIGEYAMENGLSFEYNDFILPSVLDDEERVTELIHGYKKLGRDLSNDTMHGAFFDVTVFSYDREIAKVSELRMRQSMAIAERMGLRGVVFHGNYLPFLKRDTYDQNWLQKTEETLRRLLRDYPKQQIFMENMFDCDPEMLAALAAKLTDSPNFGICFDFSHAILVGGSAETWFKTLGPYIRHMHINDHCYAGDDHLVPGDGRNDWPLYDRLVRQYAPKTTTLVEVKSFEDAKRSVEYLEKNGLYPRG